MISAAGLAAGSEAARAVSLGEAIASLLNPGAHPPAKGQKPAERSTERAQEHIVKHPRIKHPHLARSPAVTVTAHAPVEHENQPSAPPAPPIVSAKAPVDDLALPVVDPLKPHGVQTFTVSPSTAPPVAVPAAETTETTETARPAINIGRQESPRLAAVADDEAPVPPADGSGPSVRYDAILFDLLLLALVGGALLSINARTPARLTVLLRPSLRGRLRPLLAGIDRPSWIRRLFHRTRSAEPNSAGHADAPSGPPLAPPWGATWDLAVGPAGTPAMRPSKDDEARPERTLPELEDQLARIVQDQIVVPLRQAS
jgi:hypothetical protein